MKITICGSMQFDTEMQAAKEQLEALGYEVEKPNVVEGHVYEDNLDTNANLKRGFIDEHFRKIDDSDAVLIVNLDKNSVANYVGGNTLIEIAYAYAQGLEVFLLNPIPEVSYTDEIRGMHPIILNGEVVRIDEYVSSLPRLVVSSKSPVKHRALSRGLRRAGIRTQVHGQEVESGVNEQPMSIEESYEGAVNRHRNLKVLSVDAEYFATIESGQHTAHKNHGMFGCAVVIIEQAGKDAKIGIDLDVEFPREMTDKVPSKYPDLGVLVQKEYGATLKDPYPYFTNNKLTRAKMLESAIYNVAVQL
jgi:non-canonical (house-cleaning) NTP pyrophosphatase